MGEVRRVCGGVAMRPFTGTLHRLFRSAPKTAPACGRQL